MKPRAAPSVDEIEALAVKVNGIALGGQVASAEPDLMDLIYSAVPGYPGAGLQIFEAALHPQVGARSAESGAWFFQLRAPEGEGSSPHGAGAFATPHATPLREAPHV